MPFIGNKVADVAVTVGQGVIDASHIQDASITTADIGNDAITPNKVDDDGTGFQMGSLGLGTAVSGSNKLTVSGTSLLEGELEIKNGASRRISLNYEDSTNSIISHSGTSYGLESLNIRGDSITFYTDYDSGTPKGNVTLTLDNSHNATFAGAVSLGTQSSGLNAFNVNRARFQSHENNNADMSVNLAFNGSAWVNDNDSQDSQLLRLYSGQGLTYYVSSAQATPNLVSKFSVDTSGNATFAGDLTISNSIPLIYMNDTSGNDNNQIIFQAGGSNIFRIGTDITTNNGTSNFEMTNGDGNASRLTIESDGTVVIPGALQPAGNITTGGNITQSASGNLRLTQTAGGSGESSIVLTANNSTGDSFVRWETNSTTFCLGLDNSDGDKFILSAGSDPHSNSVINIQPDGSNIAIDKITSFNAPAVFNGGNITGSLTGITSSGVGGDLLFYSNGSANARLESSGDFRVVNGLKLYAGDSSLRARLHWHSFKTTLGRRYYHFHTNIPWGSSAQMYSLHFLGHAYNDSKAINTTLAFYNYDNGSVLAIGSTGTHSATVYESANDKIVLVLDLGAGNTYYSGLTISSYHTAQGVAIPSITEQGVSDNATGVY
tara:strand:+ start:2562 stop:4376 length:1815 start_codon:yes stop_codon:yes gene_type:complete